MEKKNPAEGGASKPGLGHAGAGGRRYVTAVGRGGLEPGVKRRRGACAGQAAPFLAAPQFMLMLLDRVLA